jgi:glycosyltransferase involved in cell wall biosynthesis
MVFKKITNFFYTKFVVNVKQPIQVKIHNRKTHSNTEIKPYGVNLIGFPKSDFGIGEHLRLVANAFRKVDVDFCVNDAGIKANHKSQNNSIVDLINNENKYQVNLMCLNGYEVAHYINRMKNDIRNNQYNIGYGYWELNNYPKAFKKQFNNLKEIWAPSKYIYETLKKATHLPVYHMPIAIDFEIPTNITRKDFNLPDTAFLFIFSFDMSSYMKRKNPVAVIDCFNKAFANISPKKVGLVIKFHRFKDNKDHEKAYKKLKAQIEKENIYVIDESLNRDKMLGLINCCDVYVSLHRSEGFGLGMAEAMKMGKNVIGTAYSGNMDFMNEDNSCLVPYELVEVKKEEYTYVEKNTFWAEPDNEKAIYYMKKLYEDEEYRVKLGKNAKEYMNKYHSFEYIANIYEKHISNIKSENRLYPKELTHSKIIDRLYSFYFYKILYPIRRKKAAFKIVYRHFRCNTHDYLKKFRNMKKIDGVNLIGLPRGDFGLGQHIRLATNSFSKTNINFCVNDTNLASFNPNTNLELDQYIIKENKYIINLLCFNGTYITRYFTEYMNDATDSQYNISYGYWELSIYPKVYYDEFKYLKEIWAPSKYLYEILKEATSIPVHYMPIPVDFEIPTNYKRENFNLPENYLLFLFSFDMSSITRRKNPEAVIKCFRKAFPNIDEKKVGLVIKLHRAKGNPDQDIYFEKLQREAFRSDMYIIDEIMSREKMFGLINCCDIYVSLHRSEGFGLGMAEAMKMGKIVIGTAYSGNMDFMNEENSCLVPYELVEVKKEEYIFVEDGAVWADPDLEVATEYMKKLYEDKEYRVKLGKNAKEYMDKYHSFEYIANNYEKRVSQIIIEINKI